MFNRLLRYTLFAACLMHLMPTVAYGQNPKANFSAANTAGCGPLVVSFSNTSTGTDAPLTYSWNFGNGNTSTKKSPSNIYTAPGRYTVVLTVKDNKGNTNTLTRTDYIEVYGEPDVKFGTAARGGCTPFTVQFVDSTVGNAGNAVSWIWDFGDGAIAFSQNPTHTYTTTGVYDVSLNVRNAKGCQSNLVKKKYIYVSTKPTADFTASKTLSCTVPFTVDFTSTVKTNIGGPVRYLWDFGDGGTSTQANPSHSYTNTSNFDVSLTATDSMGCSITIKKTGFVKIFRERADFKADTLSGCNPLTIKFTKLGTVFLGTNYLWYFGDGKTSTDQNPTHTYTTPGKYTVALKVVSNGCTDSLAKTNYIDVRVVPKAAFKASDSLSCKSFTVNFTDQSQNAASWLWYFGDGDSSTSQNPSHTYLSAGNYTVTLKVVATGGCLEVLTKNSYIQIGRPHAAVAPSPASGCQPLKVNYINASTSVTPVTKWDWDFGDGNKSNLKNPPSHTYSTPGVYKIRMIMTTADGCQDSSITQVKVGSKPQADFTATPTKACLSAMTVAFTNLTNTHANAADEFAWDFGDGTTSSFANPVHTYTDTPGKYTVRLIAFQNGCSDTLVRKSYIEILPPRSSFGYVKGTCDPQNVQFNDSSIGADQWFWDFGDGDNSTSQNPSHTFAYNTTRTVSLTVTNNTTLCSHTSKQTVVTPPKLRATIVASDTALCAPALIKFSSAITEPVTYKWDLGNGTKSTSATPEITYNTPGIYTIKLTVTNPNGCTFDTFRTAYVKVYGPKPEYTIDVGRGCVPFKVTFKDASTSMLPIVKWIWDFGDGTPFVTTTFPTISHTFTKSAKTQKNGFKVDMTAVDSRGCGARTSHFIVPAEPKPDFTARITPGCGEITYDFVATRTDTNGVGPLQFKWQFSDGTTSTDTVVRRKYTGYSIEKVQLTQTDAIGCSKTIFKIYTIDVPVLDAKFSLQYQQLDCPPLQVSAKDSTTKGLVGIKKWEWDFGDGTSSTLQNPEKLYSQAGDYVIRLKVTDSIGCTDTFSQNLHVKGPVGSFSFDKKKGCFPYTVNFTAITKGTTSITWDFGDGDLDSNNIVSHTYQSYGTFVPILLLSDTTCTYALPPYDTITILAPPIAAFSVAGQCDGDVTQFLPVDQPNAGNIVSYNWNFGDQQSSADSSPTHKYAKLGTYNVTLTMVNELGCTDTRVQKVTIGKIDADFDAANRVACFGTPINFKATSVADTTVVRWLWDFGDGTTDTVKNPIHFYTQKGYFDVKMTAWTATGCLDSVERDSFVAIGDTIPPQPVKIYRITTVDDRTLQFEFQRYDDVDFAYYTVLKEVPGNLFFPIDTIYNIDDTVWNINTVDALHNVYTYKVQAYNLCGVKSDLSKTAKHNNMNLVASTPLANQVVLDWNHYIGWGAVDHYELYREDVNNPGTFKLLATVPRTLNTFTDTNIVCYRLHRYKLRAVEFDFSNPHESWSDTAAAKPIYLGYVAPSEVIRTTVVNDRVINVTWSPSKSKRVKYYFIERSDDGITYKPVTGAMAPTQLSYTDKKVFVDSFYYNYRIKVQDSCGDMSQPSNVGRSILLFVDTNSNGFPVLNWTPYLDWPEGVDHYTVELRDNGGAFHEVFKTNTGALNEHTDALTDLNTQKDYCYRVIAHRASPPSTPGINDTITSMSNVACTPLQSVLFVPDAFTPNGDDYNNVFYVKGQYLKEYHLKIFDRWGTEVFESTDIDEGWDGTNKHGTMCPMDVYVYLITTRGADNKYRVTRGTITMMP